MIALITILALALVGVIAWLATLVFGKTDTPGDKVTVPNVIGQTQSEAQRVLREQGFSNVTVQAVPCQAAADGSPGPCGPENIGKVLNTEPAPNSSVKKSDKITLQVGGQPDKVSVPDVKGLSQQDATKKLTDAKLTVTVNPQQIETDDDKLIGKVADQSPPGGQSVNVGSAVTITIGKSANTVTVINVIGQDVNTAKSNLEGIGLKVQVNEVSSDQPAGKVIDQNPKSGKVKPDTTVTLSVSKGDQQKIKMPDLTGQTVNDAQQILRQRGWTGQFNQIDDPSCSAQEVNKITDQQQRPNSDIAPDETVGIQVCRRATQ
jgi:serine/threonine-protein kinase